MNLPLPKWCSPDCYKKLQEIASIGYNIHSLNRELSKLTIGPTMEMFLNNIHDEKSGRKIYLYSAQDTNLSTITHALHLTGVPVLTDYGSAIIVEKLRDKKKNVYIKVRYQLFLKN